VAKLTADGYSTLSEAEEFETDDDKEKEKEEKEKEKEKDIVYVAYGVEQEPEGLYSNSYVSDESLSDQSKPSLKSSPPLPSTSSSNQEGGPAELYTVASYSDLSDDSKKTANSSVNGVNTTLADSSNSSLSESGKRAVLNALTDLNERFQKVRPSFPFFSFLIFSSSPLPSPYSSPSPSFYFLPSSSVSFFLSLSLLLLPPLLFPLYSSFPFTSSPFP